MNVPQQPLVSALVALQFVAFGWRINREIVVGDQGRKTLLPMPDFLNLISLLAVMFCCVALPLGFGFVRSASAALAGGCVLIAFHPINEAAHYRLFSKHGRSIYTAANRDYPWMTDQEIITVTATAVIASVIAAMAWYTSK